IDLMVEKEITGLIVEENGRPVGIFTEKDVVLSYARSNHRPFSEIYLKDVMTKKLIVVKPEDGIEASISLMIKAGIKHLPVVKGKRIIGILNFCDLVQHQVGTLSSELHYLEEYLDDLHEAGKD
ncbi:MAG TPA: CBS domain-containing protein, partial [Deltaproteobacteria bacterium]|nr:CBS domain-containing protein [Deltaproteobacteria bacterium]